MTWAGPLLKPSPLARLKAKWQKRVEKRKATKIRDIATMEAWLLIRERIYTRDLGRCRVCGILTYLRHVNPLRVGHVHHVKYRSAGGTDESSNLALVCAYCHADEHETTTLSIDGDGDHDLTLTFYDSVSYRKIEERVSPCPS